MPPQLSSNLLDYELIEKMNQSASKNVENMKKLTDDIVVTNDDLNTKFGKFTVLSSLFWRQAELLNYKIRIMYQYFISR